MNFIKKLLLSLLILTVIAILFRRSIYRSVFTYESIGERMNYSVTDDKLAHYIESGASPDDPDVPQIIRSSLSLTSGQLNFTAAKNDNDPNKLIISKTAHCVGYAHFFATTCNYLLEKHNLAGDWVATPHIGQLHLLGVNVHPYLNSPFFKDHDFVIIENKMTGESYAVDPTVGDYLGIDFVTYIR